MSWAATQTSNPVTLSNAWQELTSIAAGETQVAAIQVEADFQVDAADNGEVRVLASVDGANWDTVPLAQAAVSNEQNPARITFSLEKYPHYRVEGRLTGNTDTASTMTVRYAVGG